MHSLADLISIDIQNQTVQARNMIGCKGPMSIAEAQALCEDVESLRELLKQLQRRLVRCADESIASATFLNRES